MIGSQMVLVPSRGYLKCVTLTFSVTLPYVYVWHTNGTSVCEWLPTNSKHIRSLTSDH